MHILDPTEDRGPGSGIAGCDAVKGDSQVSVCPYRLRRTVQSKSQCYHMERTAGQMVWLMCFGLGVHSATQHHTRSSERLHNSVVLCVTLPVERDETCLSPLPPLWVAESRGTCRLNWSYCSTWVNVELQMNAGYERAGRESRGCRSYDHLWNACSPSSISMSQLLFAHT